MRAVNPVSHQRTISSTAIIWRRRMPPGKKPWTRQQLPQNTVRFSERASVVEWYPPDQPHQL